MKVLFAKQSLVAVACFAAGLVHAAPFLTIDDNTVLYLKAGVQVVYEDNVFRDTHDQQEDTFFVFSPGFEVLFGTGGTATSRLSYVHTFYEYADLDRISNDYPRFELQGGIDEAVYQVNYMVRFESRASNESDANLQGILIPQDTVVGALKGKYQFSQKTAVSVGYDYMDHRYDIPGFIGTQSHAVPVTFFYRVSPKMDVTFGGRYRDVSLVEVPVEIEDSVSDFRDVMGFVGLSGELFSPKVRGDLYVGYQNREQKDLDADSVSGLSFNAGVTVAATPLFSYRLDLDRDFHVAARGGNSYTRAAATVTGMYRANDTISANFSLGYANSDYENQDREEDQILLQAGVSYDPNDYFRLSASYRRVEVDGSGQVASDYSNNSFSVSASVRY